MTRITVEIDLYWAQAEMYPKPYFGYVGGGVGSEPLIHRI